MQKADNEADERARKVKEAEEAQERLAQMEQALEAHKAAQGAEREAGEALKNGGRDLKEKVAAQADPREDVEDGAVKANAHPRAPMRRTPMDFRVVTCYTVIRWLSSLAPPSPRSPWRKMSNPQPGLLNHGNIYGATSFSSETSSPAPAGLRIRAVLKIFVHLCGHGSNHFLTELRRNSTFIQQASVYSGPPDPIHGTALYQKVRNTAQEVARLLFTDTISTKTGISPLNLVPPTMGMGSGTSHRSGMQGFGYSPGKQGTGSDSILDKIQKAAEVVASAVLPPTEHQGIRLHDNHYRAVVAPSVPIEVAVPACAYNLPARKSKAVTQWCPGQVGGGWEETDSGNSSSHNSSQDIAANSRASVGSKSAGTGSQSGASRESSGDLSERCSILNCEVVVELLSSKLQDPSNTIKMRALCAVACLMTSDLLSLEQMFGATQRKLCQLSEGTPGPVANKATKEVQDVGVCVSCLTPATAQTSAVVSPVLPLFRVQPALPTPNR
ncbi:hypothetical protein INR49_013808 [Caranx melampygus]|nr:hypothetical protein INR49_013808 [Caranx melampygus]